MSFSHVLYDDDDDNDRDDVNDDDEDMTPQSLCHVLRDESGDSTSANEDNYSWKRE